MKEKKEKRCGCPAGLRRKPHKGLTFLGLFFSALYPMLLSMAPLHLYLACRADLIAAAPDWTPCPRRNTGTAG